MTFLSLSLMFLSSFLLLYLNYIMDKRTLKMMGVCFRAFLARCLFCFLELHHFFVLIKLFHY
jgi:hypothetical protein